MTTCPVGLHEEEAPAMMTDKFLCIVQNHKSYVSIQKESTSLFMEE